jgi:hypothetical protein
MLPMHTIDLTYVGRGIHEELIAYVADQEGYFEDEGVHVAVRDGIKWETERLRGGATIGLGRALLSRLTDGIQWKMLAVKYIASFLNRLTRDEVQRYYERYIGPYFTSDGRVDLNVAQHAVNAVATELGVTAASVDQMYQADH